MTAISPRQTVMESTVENNKIAAQQELVFIHESFISKSPEQPIQHIVPDFNPVIKVPFPPNVNPTDLIRTDKNGELLTRCTNKFLIYRNEYAKELKALGYKLSMRKVSSIAANSWKEEPEYVVRYYEEIAREVEKIHLQLSMSSSTNSDWQRNHTKKNVRYNPLHATSRVNHTASSSSIKTTTTSNTTTTTTLAHNTASCNSSNTVTPSHSPISTPLAQTSNIVPSMQNQIGLSVGGPPCIMMTADNSARLMTTTMYDPSVMAIPHTYALDPYAAQGAQLSESSVNQSFTFPFGVLIDFGMTQGCGWSEIPYNY